MSVLVIAEPGCTHEGDYAAIVRLIHATKAAGADVFKNQWMSSPKRVCERRNAHEYRAFYDWLNYPLDWHLSFRRICRELGLQYACSVYLPDDVETMAPMVDYLKISSFEAEDQGLLAAVRPLKERVIVSLGMQDEDVTSWGWRTLPHHLLHCVSSYPAPISQLQLRSMSALGLGGLSDHSRHLLAGAVAVSLGASMVEAHIRLDDCSPKNPDYAVAFSPKEFKQYVQNIRDAEVMLGDGVKRVQPCEVSMLKYRVA